MENATGNALAEDWELLMSFFPCDWRKQAQTCGALKGLRQDKSAEEYLRVLLLHLGCGFSLRETAVRAQRAGLADRGYCHAEALGEVARQGAFFTVRLNPQGIRLQTPGGDREPLVEHLQELQGAGQTAEWPVRIPLPSPQPPLAVRLCAVRKSAAAIALAQQRLRRKARKQGWQVQPESLLYAQ
jgi:hypothetical protein